MDTDFLRSRYRVASNLKVDRHKFGAYKKQITVPVEAPQNKIITTAITSLDFAIGASIFKKRQRADNLYKALLEALLIILAFVLTIVLIGVVINYKYQGRAFPFTYIGDTSVGGMNKQQVQDLLSQKYDEMKVIFIEGGLTRAASLKQLGVELDINAAVNGAVPERKNPFALFYWQRHEVPVEVNPIIADGFLTTRLYPTQSKSENAQIIIEDDELKIQPEINGIRTELNFMTGQIKDSLSRVAEPNINACAVVAKPAVYSSDLQDDLTHINNLLNTPVAINIGYANIKPTFKQKLSWLNLGRATESKNVDVDFSEGLVRGYIIEQAKRVISNDTNVYNIDEVTSAIMAALKNGEPISQKLTIEDQSSNGSSNTIASR